MMPSEQMATARGPVQRYRSALARRAALLRGRWWRRPGAAGRRGCRPRLRRTRRRLPPRRRACWGRGSTSTSSPSTSAATAAAPAAGASSSDYDELVGDLASVIDVEPRAQLPTLPRFVLAHSNGGQVALRHGARRARLDRRADRLEPRHPGRGADPAGQAQARPRAGQGRPWITLQGELNRRDA